MRQLAALPGALLGAQIGTQRGEPNCCEVCRTAVYSCRFSGGADLSRIAAQAWTERQCVGMSRIGLKRRENGQPCNVVGGYVQV